MADPLQQRHHADWVSVQNWRIPPGAPGDHLMVINGELLKIPADENPASSACVKS